MHLHGVVHCIHRHHVDNLHLDTVIDRVCNNELDQLATCHAVIVGTAVRIATNPLDLCVAAVQRLLGNVVCVLVHHSDVSTTILWRIVAVQVGAALRQTHAQTSATVHAYMWH
jgi:hypothetical protein